MIALPHFNEFIILFAGVAIGLVDGTTAPITPIALAIFVIPLSIFSSIIP